VRTLASVSGHFCRSLDIFTRQNDNRSLHEAQVTRITGVSEVAVFPTTSTETDNYTLVQLPVGPYEVTVTVAGFKTFVRSGIAVQMKQTLRVDIPLEVGAASDSVTVGPREAC
jgi:hypothetical protein